MRSALAFAFVLGSLALTAQAQHGGGGGHAGGGFGGGHAGGGFGGGHAGASFGGHLGGGFSGAHAGSFGGGVRSGGFNSAQRSFPSVPRGYSFANPGYRGLPSTTRPGFYSGQHMSTGPSFRAPGYGYSGRTLGNRYSAPARSSFYNRYGGATGLHYGNRYGGRYGYGYGFHRDYYPRFFSPVFLSYGFYNPYFWGFDPFWNTGDWFDSELSPYSYDGTSGYAAQPYANQGYTNQSYPDQGYNGPQAPSGQEPPAAPAESAQAPGPWAPQAYGQPYAEPGAAAGPDTVPLQENTVTILFKDGRQPEKVRNYALTRTSLFVSGPHARVIPVDEIDLAGTERLNHAAGVDFRMP